MRPKASWIVVTLVLVGTLPTRLGAQPILDDADASETADPAIRLSGFSLGLVAGGLLTTAWRWTSVGGDGAGFNAAVATMPQVFGMGALPIVAEIGPTFGAPFRGGAFFVNASFGAIAAAGPGGAAATIQFGLGGTLLFQVSDPVALRIDYSRHYLAGQFDGYAPVLEAGIVMVGS